MTLLLFKNNSRFESLDLTYTYTYIGKERVRRHENAVRPLVGN
jgi:hypothetical protein